MSVSLLSSFSLILRKEASDIIRGLFFSSWQELSVPKETIGFMCEVEWGAEVCSNDFSNRKKEMRSAVQILEFYFEVLYIPFQIVHMHYIYEAILI